MPANPLTCLIGERTPTPYKSKTAQHAKEASVPDTEEEVEDHRGSGHQAEGRRIHRQRECSAGRETNIQSGETALHHWQRNTQARYQVRRSKVKVSNYIGQ